MVLPRLTFYPKLPMSKMLRVKHLLGIKDLHREDIELILQTADTFLDVINRPIKKVPSLRDTTIVNLFFDGMLTAGSVWALNAIIEYYENAGK